MDTRKNDILQGTLELLRPPAGGTLVVLEVPLAQGAAVGRPS